VQKNIDKNTNEKNLHHSSSTFFEFSSSLLLEYGRKIHLFYKIVVYRWKNQFETLGQSCQSRYFNNASSVVQLDMEYFYFITTNSEH